jgi:magnesium-transporting ATPase (P-type)
VTSKRFNWKSFISFGMFFAFFMLVITGLVLYITPPGRVAKWVNWEFLGFSKTQWQEQHTMFSYTFLVLTVFHIFTMNWKVFWSYIKKRKSEGFHRKKEFAAGVVLFLVVFFGTLFYVPPFKNVIDLGEHFTDSWEKKSEKAPMAHTEELSINDLSQKLVKLSPSDITKKLESKGINVRDNDQTLKEIGEENNKSPMEIYNMISEKEEIRKEGPGNIRGGGGIGKKTLKEIADQIDVSVSVLTEKLKNAGIEAGPQDSLKDIANREGKMAHDLIEILNKIE